MSAIAFIHDLRFADLPPAVVAQTKRCWLDLAGVWASGTETDLSRIVRGFAVDQMAAGRGGAILPFDGRRASVAGAALAGASTIDSFDAHDGHALTKGHAGVALLPALLAFAEETGLRDGREALLLLCLGYEIATRAGIALHASVADYHTSGAWNALGCAAIGARRLGLDPDRTRHALGIAEYHGPRSQMMRCIAHPTMLKDGSGWGAVAGVSAAYLARDGFTGAPAITLEAAGQDPLWADLGTRWRILEQYVKPHPVCRWAQPAIEAVAELRRAHGLPAEDVAAVEIATFAEAVALGTAAPATTEEAQYAIGFPVAALLVAGRVGAREIGPEGLADPAIRAMLGVIALREEPAFSAAFPADRLAAVTIRLRDGTALSSPPTRPRGDPGDPLPDAEIAAKFATLAAALAPGRRAAIADAIAALDRDADALDRLLAAMAGPVDGAA